MCAFIYLWYCSSASYLNPGPNHSLNHNLNSNANANPNPSIAITAPVAVTPEAATTNAATAPAESAADGADTGAAASGSVETATVPGADSDHEAQIQSTKPTPGTTDPAPVAATDTVTAQTKSSALDLSSWLAALSFTDFQPALSATSFATLRDVQEAVSQGRLTTSDLTLHGLSMVRSLRFLHEIRTA